MCMCVYGYGYIHVSAGTLGGQRHLISLELELRTVVSSLMREVGIKLWSTARAIHIPNHLDIASAILSLS